MTEDRVPQELARLMDGAMLLRPMDERERIAFRGGVTLALEYCSVELESLMTALKNAKPRLTDGWRTVRG